MTPETETTAPSTQRITRNDSSLRIIIETLTSKHFERAREIENDFVAGKGCCFGTCTYAWCPTAKDEFESFYSKDADRCSTYGLAIREADDQSSVVVGSVTLRQGGQKTKLEEDVVYKPKADEMYVEHIVVTKDVRGMGVGTKLLEWSEQKARERGANRLSLGVVKGNPAKRLYDRFGFVDVSNDGISLNSCMIACMLGRPHGQFGGYMMEKKLV